MVENENIGIVDEQIRGNIIGYILDNKNYILFDSENYFVGFVMLDIQKKVMEELQQIGAF